MLREQPELQQVGGDHAQGGEGHPDAKRPITGARILDHIPEQQCAPDDHVDGDHVHGGRGGRRDHSPRRGGEQFGLDGVARLLGLNGKRRRGGHRLLLDFCGRDGDGGDRGGGRRALLQRLEA